MLSEVSPFRAGVCGFYTLLLHGQFNVHAQDRPGRLRRTGRNAKNIGASVSLTENVILSSHSCVISIIFWLRGWPLGAPCTSFFSTGPTFSKESCRSRLCGWISYPGFKERSFLSVSRLLSPSTMRLFVLTLISLLGGREGGRAGEERE